MTDRLNKLQRSANMSAVKGYSNKSTELKLISLFKEYRIRGWRRHSKKFGRPDFIFPKSKLAIFVDGCFWHGCKIHRTIPQSNKDFWLKKINTNRRRDRLVSSFYKDSKWGIIRLWEHDLKKINNSLKIIKKIGGYLNN